MLLLIDDDRDNLLIDHDLDNVFTGNDLDHLPVDHEDLEIVLTFFMNSYVKIPATKNK